MNREIKFRAWDSIAGKMWEDVYLDGGHIYTIGPDGENASTMPRWEDNAIMQFTGLLDKNGKEIYESDIIQYQNESADRTPVLVPIMTPKNLEYILSIGNSEWEEQENQYSNIEVIGNIYENKELLE